MLAVLNEDQRSEEQRKQKKKISLLTNVDTKHPVFSATLGSSQRHFGQFNNRTLFIHRFS